MNHYMIHNLGYPAAAAYCLTAWIFMRNLINGTFGNGTHHHHHHQYAVVVLPIGLILFLTRQQQR